MLNMYFAIKQWVSKVALVIKNSNIVNINKKKCNFNFIRSILKILTQVT